jgi:hypothetical protein
MASFLFTCTGCLAVQRLPDRSEAPPDFDNLCDDCRTQAAVDIAAPEPPRPARTGRRGN